MSYNTIPVHVPGKDSMQKKAEITREAEKRKMSVSAFMMMCYELVVAARRKKDERDK